MTVSPVRARASCKTIAPTPPAAAVTSSVPVASFSFRWSNIGSLRARLQGISPKVLTQTLRRLEDHGLVVREIYAEVPLRVEYSLTLLGADACAPLAHLRTWVEQNISRFPA